MMMMMMMMIIIIIIIRVIPSIPNDTWKSPQEKTRTSFLRHQLIYYKKYDRQGLGLRCQIHHCFPATWASHCLSLFLSPATLWSRSNDASRIFPTMRQSLQRAMEPFTGKSLLNTHLWFQTNANSLGTNSLGWSLNALSLCHMPSPLLTPVHGCARTWSKGFDFPAEQWESYADQADPHSERRKGRKLISTEESTVCYQVFYIHNDT